MRKWIALWLFLVLLLSLAPFPVKKFFGTMGPLHNYGHFAIFCATGIMLLHVETTRPARLAAFMFLFLFCAVTEGLQYLLYHNPFEWSDLLVDCSGLILSPVSKTLWDRLYSLSEP